MNTNLATSSVVTPPSELHTRVDITMHTVNTSVELAGSQRFVTHYLAELRALGALDAAYNLPPKRAKVAGGGGESKRPAEGGIDALLDSVFGASARRNVGDLILVFGYYINEVQRRPYFSSEDLEFHFAHSGIKAPLSLANALGTLKRKQGFIAPGDKRGTYVLTSVGRREVQQRLARGGA